MARSNLDVLEELVEITESSHPRYARDGKPSLVTVVPKHETEGPHHHNIPTCADTIPALPQVSDVLLEARSTVQHAALLHHLGCFIGSDSKET